MEKNNESEENLISLIREIGAEVFEALYIKVTTEISDYVKKHRNKK